MKTILYPGTFDPITKGHIDLIERASRLFDQVVIAIAESKRKQPLFDFEERKTLCEQSLKHIDNLQYCAFSGLIIHAATQHQACAVLRGVRSVSDFDYELPMANMNQAMQAGFETLFLAPKPELASISSTLIREIASMQGDVSNFVSPAVLNALTQKFA